MLPSPTAAATRLTGPERTVAAGENAGHAGLEQIGIAVETPAAGGGHVDAREHVAAPVERYLIGQPGRLGIGPDEDEASPGLEPRRLAGLAIDADDGGAT